MHDDDEFLRSIPPFLRRYGELPSKKLSIRTKGILAPISGPPISGPPVSGPAAPQPAISQPARQDSSEDSAAAPAPPKVPSSTAQPSETQPPKPPMPEPQMPGPQVIDLAARQAETPQVKPAQVKPAQVKPVQAGSTLAEQHARIEGAFDTEIGSDDTADADVAFQVTLPRGVIRQIRVLAAEKDTTQRAIVLRALRLAGLWIPEGTDVDRRGRTAKRRQQA